jgi:hypothetical protein
MSGKKFLVILFAAALLVGGLGVTNALADGASDYATYCQSCHGSLANSNVNGTTVASVRTAISRYGMGNSGSLSDAQIQAILDAIHGTTTPTACTSFTYGNWSTCDATGHQTRTWTGVPAGCTGTPPAAQLTQTCTPPPTACTSFTYGNWSTCDATGHQTRTWTGVPAGCTGTPPAAQLTQTCTNVPSACTGYEYSAWAPSPCPESGQQTRTVTANTPAGCTGTPSTSPVLTQVCNYDPPVTPPPTGDAMPVPTSREVFSYDPVDLPLISSDPAQAEPIGVGPVAGGGDTIDVNVQIGPFEAPVDMSLVVYAPAIDSEDLYFMNSRGEMRKLSRAVGDDYESRRSGQSISRAQGAQLLQEFDRVIRWKDNVTGVDENTFTGPVTALPPGQYTLVLTVRSREDHNNFYRWMTRFIVPRSGDSHDHHQGDPENEGHDD